MTRLYFVLLMTLAVCSLHGEEQVIIRFRAAAGGQEVRCGGSYFGIGSGGSAVSLKDLRFYLHHLRLVDDKGGEVPVALEQDGKWQLDDVALVDLEDGSGACKNGSPEVHAQVTGSISAAAKVTGVRFTLGVPFQKNHSDSLAAEPPLNLTAMAWVWNAGRRFMRIELASVKSRQGFSFHLGSTGCMPESPLNASPTKCTTPNRSEIEIMGFDPSKEAISIDLGALFSGINVDVAGACESTPGAESCAPLFERLGLPFGGKASVAQAVFRSGR